MKKLKNKFRRKSKIKYRSLFIMYKIVLMYYTEKRKQEFKIVLLNEMVLSLFIITRKLEKYLKHKNGDNILVETDYNTLLESSKNIIKNLIVLNKKIIDGKVILDTDEKSFLINAFDDLINDLNKYNIVGNLVCDLVDSVRELNLKGE